MSKCTYVKNNGEPCTKDGLEKYGGLCYPHSKSKKAKEKEIFGEHQKCKEPDCTSVGLEQSDGYCYPHYLESKGLEVGKYRIRAIGVYMNGAIGIKGVGPGEEINVTPAQWDQIQADDPHAFERVL